MNRWLTPLSGAGITMLLVACGSSGSSRPAPASTAGTTASAEALPAATPTESSSALCGSADAVSRRMGEKNFTVYNATTDPHQLLGRQGEYTSKVIWTINGETSGIEAFPDTADAQVRYTYLRGFRPPIGDGYDYLYGDAILRLASAYTPSQASKLKAAFENACHES